MTAAQSLSEHDNPYDSRNDQGERGRFWYGRDAIRSVDCAGRALNAETADRVSVGIEDAEAGDPHG